jgi:uncharacterized protein
MLSIDTDGFLESVQRGDMTKVNHFLATNPKLSNSKAKNGVSAILQAFYYGHPDIARAIAEKKSELDIFEAGVLGKLDRVKNLVTSDPSLARSYSPDGFTALALAAYLGQKEVTEYLIANGSDVNAVAKNPTGFTALTGATANNHTEIAKILVNHGADVNHRYEEGVSPLMEASLNGNAELAKFFLEEGADPNAKMKDGKSPLSFAKEKNHPEVVDILKKNGAI